MGPELSFVPCPLVHVSAIRWAGGGGAWLSYHMLRGLRKVYKLYDYKARAAARIVMGLTQIETLK